MAVRTQVSKRWWVFPWDDRCELQLAQVSALKLRELGTLRLKDSEEGSILGIAELYRLKYIGEVVLNEMDVAVSDEEVERIIHLKQPPSDKLERKIYNLGQAADYLFPLSQAVMHNRPPEMLTIELIQEVHRKIMEGLLDSAGSFRQKEAAPVGQTLYFYKTPRRIEAALHALCTETASKWAAAQRQDVDTAEYVIVLTRIAGDFLGKFLDIHPFSNGNGRTSRLLLSCILNNICIVPLSLSVPGIKPSRDIYIRTLEEARQNVLHDYTTLHALVLEGVHRNIERLHWWLS